MGNRVKIKFTLAEIMIYNAALEVHNGDKVVIGQGLPIVACSLAKNFHAPEAVLMTEAGLVDIDPYRSPLHIADPTCLKGFSYSCDLVDIFTTILNRGLVDVCFLGVGQTDKYGNLNSTVVGDYTNPKMRMMGAGGAPDFGVYAKRVILTMRGGKFVEKLDYFTTPGWLEGGDSKKRAGLPDTGPEVLISTKAVFRFPAPEHELTLWSLHPGFKLEDVQKDIPWKLKVSKEIKTTPAPTKAAIDFIRDFDPTLTAGRKLGITLALQATMRKQAELAKRKEEKKS
jgi:glutaconate CoA-transferase, subunit B